MQAQNQGSFRTNQPVPELIPSRVPESKMSWPACKAIEKEDQSRVETGTINPNRSSENKEDQHWDDNFSADSSTCDHGRGRTATCKEREKGCVQFSYDLQ